MSRYRTDPVGYAENILGVQWWDVQKEIARALLEPPYRVAVQAAHGVGKTFLAAGLVNWWYDTRDPGAVLTTAPTKEHVQDVLWKEVRLQRKGRSGFIGPSAPVLRSSPDHYAVGITTSKGEAFQGRHDISLLGIFDEAVGVDGIFYDTGKSMFKPEPNYAWLIIFNPTDTTSRAYQEVRSGRWKVIKMSAMDHPNIALELAGKAPLFPSAVSLAQLSEAVEENCDPVQPGDERQAEDFEFPPGSGRWWRPGPVFQARWAGLWPSQGTYGVWSEALWQAIITAPAEIPADGKLELGCDVARHGDNWTVIHGQVGGVSMHHERHNGWDTKRTAARLRELCQEYGPRYNCLPERVRVKIDEVGVGGPVVDQACGYNFIGCSASRAPIRPQDYPSCYSEFWFFTASLARKRLMSLSRLPKDDLLRLEQQAMAPEWDIDVVGRKKVDPKEVTRDKMGFSPDDMDALNLAYYPAAGAGAMVAVDTTVAKPTPAPRQTLEQRAEQHKRASGHRLGRRT